MKLTPNQKELLACIKDKEIRKEVKKEFKKKITFYHTRWKLLDEYDFKNDDFISKNPEVSGYFGKHPMNGVLFKEEFERTFGEGFPWYEMESKKVEERFDELANEFISPEKAIEILSQREKIKSEIWYKTFDLRYANKSIQIDEHIGKNELRLQQKLFSNQGNEKWEWIPEFVE